MALAQPDDNVRRIEHHLERMLERVREIEREMMLQLYALRLSQDGAYAERAARTLREEQAGVPDDVMSPEQWAKHLADA